MLLAVLFCVSLCVSLCTCQPVDKQVMLDLIDSISGWPGSWRRDDIDNYCDWDGVYCNALQRVTEIRLSLSGFQVLGYPLQGTIPPSIANLTELTTFIHDPGFVPSHIHGTIPLGLWQLPNLKTLILNNNLLEGTLPETISPSLETVELLMNNLNGTIPAAFGSLRRLFLRGNKFTCPLPLELIEFMKRDSFQHGGDFSFNHFEIVNNSVCGQMHVSETDCFVYPQINPPPPDPDPSEVIAQITTADNQYRLQATERFVYYSLGAPELGFHQVLEIQGFQFGYAETGYSLQTAGFEGFQRVVVEDHRSILIARFSNGLLTNMTLDWIIREEENYTAMGVKMTFVFYNWTNFEEDPESRALIDFSVLLHTIGDIAKNDPLECEIGAFVLSYCRSDIFSNIITPIEEESLQYILLFPTGAHARMKWDYNYFVDDEPNATQLILYADDIYHPLESAVRLSKMKQIGMPLPRPIPGVPQYHTAAASLKYKPFKEILYYDPEFSLLFDLKKASEPESDSSNEAAIGAGIAVGVLAVVVVVVLVVVFKTPSLRERLFPYWRRKDGVVHIPPPQGEEEKPSGGWKSATTENIAVVNY